MNTNLKPFLRWAGGKTWLIPYINQKLSKIQFNDYHEPFLGGGAVYFAVANNHNSFLSDINNQLVETYCSVKSNYKSIYKYLRDMPNTKEDYMRIRSEKYTCKYQRAAQFIYLNSNCYNGLYRVNRLGEYNVPYGYHKSFNYPLEKLSAASDFLNKTKANIQVADFCQSLSNVKKGDFVFLDPPYTISDGKENGFIEYNETLFSLNDQRRLSEALQNLNKIGAYFILTNAKHETIYKIFKDVGYCYDLERASLIGGVNAKRGKINEYIFTNISEVI